MDKPTVYILHGDDTFGIQRVLDGLLARMGDPAMADLNTTRYDGREASEEVVRSAANSMPFLSDRRMVILNHPFARLNSEAARARFRELLDGLPESTALVLIIEDSYERRDWRTLRQDHWLRRWSDAAGSRAYYQLCQLPAHSSMPEWVRKEARSLGGQFTSEAAAALVSHIGNDTRTASLEIEKLLLYVDRQRQVEAQDVEELSTQTAQADVFQMVDAMSAGNASLALNLLHRLMEEEDELNLFGMIVRQFRLLLVGREMFAEGRTSADFAKGLARNEFVARKSMEQARRFSQDRLDSIYHRLLEIDEGVKTGQTSLPVALDVLVVELAR
jgi:DNA polymerase-3 subunit delta